MRTVRSILLRWLLGEDLSLKLTDLTNEIAHLRHKVAILEDAQRVLNRASYIDSNPST